MLQVIKRFVALVRFRTKLVNMYVQVIQLQGDQRKHVSQFLVQAGVVKKDLIKIHGF